MSAEFARFRVLAMVAVFFLGASVAGCSGQTGDTGATRTQQQSQELQNRINTTQIDR